MKTKTLVITFAIIFLFALKLASAISVNADYITVYPGEQGQVKIDVKNNENFDIERVSITLNLGNLPFNVVGSSEKDIDDLNEDDKDSATFIIKASTDIKPGDYQIPYVISYTNVQTGNKDSKTGNFGIRVSSKTELDFVAETTGNAIVGQQGKISLEIINKGLGEIKSVSVQIFPEGFTLLSPDKTFIGTINGDDTDLATYEVIYSGTSPTLNAKISYKDFDNNDQSKTVNIPFKVYTEEEALKLGIIKKSNTGIYFGFIIVVIIAWIIYRKIKKRNKKNKKNLEN
jgi:hypothetical protein